MNDHKKMTYAAAGVDIDAGNRAVDLIRGMVRSTFKPGVMTDIGGFGGLFSLDVGKYKEPVLVASTDGVGTKLRVAMMINRHDTIGIDAVAMCANDVLVQGAEPLFFLDYLAVGKLVPEKVAMIVSGVAEGCRQAGCALIGGETAEMPGFYGVEEYDIAGFIVGVVEKDRIINGSCIRPGDRLVALPSSGLHSNGFSLVRKVIFEIAGYSPADCVEELGRTIGEELVEPTRIYVRTVLPLLKEFTIKGMAHITGGGITENVPRMLPEGTAALIDRCAWEPHAVFNLIRRAGNIDEEEMLKTFNMGVGLVMAVREDEAGRVIEALAEKGERAFAIGEIVHSSDRKVLYK